MANGKSHVKKKAPEDWNRLTETLINLARQRREVTRIQSQGKIAKHAVGRCAN